MQDYEQKALKFFNESHNCSQSVLAALSSELGLSEQQAIAVAAGFGAGVCFQGQICGAVSGAYMVLGLHSGNQFNDGESIKENTYQLINYFNKEFKQIHKETNCTKLVGFDISTSEGMNSAIEQGVFSSRCPNFVQSAVSICKKIFSKYN